MVNPTNYLNNLTSARPTVWKRLGNAKAVGIDGTLLSLPFVGYAAATAPRGYKGADAISAGVSELVVCPALTAITYLGISFLLPGIGASMGIAMVASLIASPAISFIDTRLNRGFRQFRDIDKNTRRLQLGYTDTPGAQLQRQTALQDMSGAMGSRRRFIGREAEMLHR